MAVQSPARCNSGVEMIVTRRTFLCGAAVFLIPFIEQCAALGGEPPKGLARPVADGPFLVPAPGEASEPIWGVKGGIAVGLWPLPGPRGLIRLYAPYLGHPPGRVINFVAIEPIVGRARGLSELERSALDGTDGKAIWSRDSWQDDANPRPPWQPARGRRGRDGKAETLTVAFFVETFENGARPVVEIILRDDRPNEVAFRSFSRDGGAAMKACVLTATMGNYARLRRLWLDD